MKRLTEWKRLPEDLPYADLYCDIMSALGDGRAIIKDECRLTVKNRDYLTAARRLSEYEDTGLTPEEVKALIDVSMGKAIAETTEFDGVSIQRLKELAAAWTSGNIMVISRAHWTYWYGWRGNHDRRIDDATCSRCGFRHPTIRPTKDDPYTPHQLWNCCPHCLAMMVEDNVERR